MNKAEYDTLDSASKVNLRMALQSIKGGLGSLLLKNAVSGDKDLLLKVSEGLTKTYMDSMKEREAIGGYDLKVSAATWKKTYPKLWDRVRAYLGLVVFRIPSQLKKAKWYVGLFPYTLEVYVIPPEDWDEAEDGPIPKPEAYLVIVDPRKQVDIELYIQPTQTVSQIELKFVVK